MKGTTVTTGSNPVPPHQSAAAAPNTDQRTDDPGVSTATPQPDEETALLRWEGLPVDATVLVPSLGPTPMRTPHDAWAMLVLAVDILGDVDPDTAGQVALFTATWLRGRPPADLHDGDLVIRLTPPDQDPDLPEGDEHAVDVEMLLAYRGRWLPVGRWSGMDERWPWTLAPTAAAVMSLYVDAAETLSRDMVLNSERPGSSPFRWAGTVVSDLLTAKLLEVGDELVWDRRAGQVRHTARIRMDGTFLLADERVFATPSAAATALGGKHHHGWSAWRRTADGRALDDLRAELRAPHER
ncbi:restriction system modified-DNA reader domain-containing protein [Saccharothrix deserti]|uniref:restriction system modified-DNA reader domain-containing protein n=1 Tax=Saccharothrix deserti TaxID=2593674 RepID=UPI00131D21B8|nr:hypothetical protein [Saccharothrix deserti]